MGARASSCLALAAYLLLSGCPQFCTCARFPYQLRINFLSWNSASGPLEGVVELSAQAPIHFACPGSGDSRVTCGESWMDLQFVGLAPDPALLMTMTALRAGVSTTTSSTVSFSQTGSEACCPIMSAEVLVDI